MMQCINNTLNYSVNIRSSNQRIRFFGCGKNAGKARLPRRNASELKKFILVLSQSFIDGVQKVYGGQNMSQLKSKTALVTGDRASRGSCAGIALELAAAGSSVVVNYASDKSGRGGRDCSFDQREWWASDRGFKVISRTLADVVRLFAEMADTFGSMDILVNNAGVYQAMPISDITEVSSIAK